MDKNTMFTVLLVALAGFAFLMFKKIESSKTTTAQTQTNPSPSGTPPDMWTALLASLGTEQGSNALGNIAATSVGFLGGAWNWASNAFSNGWNSLFTQQGAVIDGTWSNANRGSGTDLEFD